MKILVDMNLSPKWVPVFEEVGWEACHWSTIGDPRSTDQTIMEWARGAEFVIFTHDLDFGRLLALARSGGPSVIQVHTQDVTPKHLGHLVANTIRKYSMELESGAMVTIDEARARVRILPLNR